MNVLSHDLQRDIAARCASVRHNPHGFEYRDADAAIAWAEAQLASSLPDNGAEVLAAYCGSMEDDGQCPH